MIRKPRVGILVDGRRLPLYQPGLVERLEHAFKIEGAIVKTIDLARTGQDVDVVGVFDALYPLPVVPSKALSLLRSVDEAPWLVNSLKAQIQSLDKRSTIEAMSEAGVPYPETLDTSDVAKVLSFVKKYHRAIIKSTDQVAGLGHYVVEAEGEEIFAWVPNIARHRQLGKTRTSDQPAGWRVPLKLVEPTDTGTRRHDECPRTPGSAPSPKAHGPFLVQRFVGARLPEQMRDRVYRLYVLGRKPIFGSARVMRESQSGDLSFAIVNYAWGGEYELIPLRELSPRMVEVGLGAARALEFDVGAIDLIEDEDGDWLALEVETDNLIYHICRGFGQAPGYGDAFDLDRAAAQYVIDCLKGGRRPSRNVQEEDDIRAMFKLLSGGETLGGSI